MQQPEPATCIASRLARSISFGRMPDMEREGMVGSVTVTAVASARWPWVATCGVSDEFSLARARARAHHARVRVDTTGRYDYYTLIYANSISFELSQHPSPRSATQRRSRHATARRLACGMIIMIHILA